jgi:hypothetical protein
MTLSFEIQTAGTDVYLKQYMLNKSTNRQIKVFETGCLFSKLCNVVIHESNTPHGLILDVIPEKKEHHR